MQAGGPAFFSSANMSDPQKHIKRKRLARPLTLVLFGVLFLVLPFLNYFTFAYQSRIPLQLVWVVLRAMDPVFLILTLMPFAVGVGLLAVKKWGWYSFLVFAGLLIGYNLFTLAVNPVLTNLGALLNALLGCAAAFYFVRRDISAPYMKMYPRGWRYQKRRPHRIGVQIDGEERETSDMSASGFYVEWENCPYQPNDTVRIKFDREQEQFDIEGGVVRVDDRGAGFAFRGLTASQKKALRKLV